MSRMIGTIISLLIVCQQSRTETVNNQLIDRVEYPFYSLEQIGLNKGDFESDSKLAKLETLDFREVPEANYHKIADIEKFGSEAGKDYFYMLYALFQAQELNIENDSASINELTRMYYHLNEIDRLLNHNASINGHQIARIPAFAIYDFLNQSPLSQACEGQELDAFIKTLQHEIEEAIAYDGWYEKGTKDRKDWEERLQLNFNGIKLYLIK